MTFIHAKGPVRYGAAIPSSAFSKGDLLQFDSASSLSRWNVLLTAGTLAGVALSDSLESLSNLCPYAEALPETVWISTATTGSQFTPGEKLDVEYTGAVFRVSTSANTPTVVIAVDGASTDMIGSNSSRVMVTFDPDATVWRS
jgi:hypothetical protein